MNLERIAEAAQGWSVRKADSGRWEIVDGGHRWAPIPTLVNGAVWEARYVPRAVAHAALEAYREGRMPEPWRISR